jgi:GNAT superfamily N-acetyltransferase
MEYRIAREEDQAEIVAVLKASLGEQLMPKTIAFWRWKHEENPFGKSHVLLALQESKIVGVRAFLRWNWEKDGRLYHALRAVDTAVLPDFQGKGIFLKLTMASLEICKEEGCDFVFNTPNKISLPGYLKMGWVKFGRLPLQIKLFSSAFAKSKDEGPTKLSNPESIFEDLSACDLGMQTQITPEFLKWRYLLCPTVNYKWISDLRTFALVYRIKQGLLGKELRIVDVFAFQNNVIDRKRINQMLLTCARKEKVRYISCMGTAAKGFRLEGMGTLPTLQAGPELTLRDLNMGPSFEDLFNRKSWGFSLGDLEVF